MTTPLFNPFSDDFTTDPYPHYRRLREEDAIHKSFMGTWVVSRYADAAAVLRDERFSSDLKNWRDFDQRYANRDGVSWLLTGSVLNQDPPVHTALRKTIVQSFGPKDQTRLTDIITGIMHKTLSRCEQLQHFDAVAEYALPVPVHTVCRIFDVATSDETRVKDWSTEVSSLIEPLPTGPVLQDADASVEQFRQYLSAKMNSGSGDGLAERVGRATGQHDVNIEQVLASLVLMFPAGHETTVNLIGNGLLTLLRHPDQLEWLVSDPSLWRTAIEEMLRFESPQQVAWRIALEDIELGDSVIPKGDQLLVLLGAANRDPDVFVDPESFNIARKPNRHLAFGLGRHTCLGGWFARHQGHLALQSMIERLPGLRLDGDPIWYPTLSFHGLQELPVRVS